MRLIRLFMMNLARLFTSAVFLAGGVKNVLHWHETEKSLMNVLSEWRSYLDFSQEAQAILSFLIPWTAILQLVATALALVGGVLLLLGIRERLGSTLLILFLIPVTILYHPFWWTYGAHHEIQTVMFLKNLAILGLLIQMILNHSRVSVRRDSFEIMQ